MNVNQDENNKLITIDPRLFTIAGSTCGGFLLWEFNKLYYLNNEAVEMTYEYFQECFSMGVEEFFSAINKLVSKELVFQRKATGTLLYKINYQKYQEVINDEC